MKRIKIFVFVILACLLASCARVYVPYTLQLQQDYNLTDEEIMQLQFYVSDKVILEREIVDVDKKVSKKHRLEKVEDKLLDQVLFRSLTPGVAKDLVPFMLRVAFEEQGYLTFKSEGEPEDYFYFKSDRYGNEIKEKIISYCTWFQLIEDAEYNRRDVFVELDDDAKKIWQRYDGLKKIKDPFYRKNEFLEFRKDFYEYVISVPAKYVNCGEEHPSGIVYAPFSSLDFCYDKDTGWKRGADDGGCYVY